MAELPRGTVTFLFSDIEGSTRLLEQLGDRYSDVLRDHRRILRERLEVANGQEIDTQGDAFFFSFTRAKDAVTGAVTAQRALAAHEWPEGLAVKTRMGLHTGEPNVGEEGYVGLDVVRAARICTVGRGGQILLSETTRALVGSGLPDGVSVFPVGQRHLRGIDEPERVFEIAIDDLERQESSRAAEESVDVAVPAPPEPPAPPGPGSELDGDLSRRFEDFGARLSAGIKESVLRSLEEKVTRKGGGGDPSAVDDIASRFETLGAEIDSRIQAALRKKGIEE